MKHLPSALFVVDGIYEKNAIAEANVLGIPTFGMVDTNTNPDRESKETAHIGIIPFSGLGIILVQIDNNHKSGSEK